MNADELREGDVLRYNSERENNWCREGVAVVHRRREGSLVAVDTFWGSSLRGGFGADDHVLTDAELASAWIKFNLADYDELSTGADDYAPRDRAVITSQHRLQHIYLVRKGATPSEAVIVSKYVDLVRQARDELRRAEGRLRWAEDDLRQAFARRGNGGVA